MEKEDRNRTIEPTANYIPVVVLIHFVGFEVLSSDTCNIHLDSSIYSLSCL